MLMLPAKGLHTAVVLHSIHVSALVVAPPVPLHAVVVGVVYCKHLPHSSGLRRIEHLHGTHVLATGGAAGTPRTLACVPVEETRPRE